MSKTRNKERTSTPDSTPKTSNSSIIESFVYHQQKPPLNVRSPSTMYESRPSSSLIMDKQNPVNFKNTDSAKNEINSLDFTSKKSPDQDQIVYGEDRCNHCGGLFSEVILSFLIIIFYFRLVENQKSIHNIVVRNVETILNENNQINVYLERI